MGFRTVVINSRCKLSLQLGYLVCRGEEEGRIHLKEISTIIIQNPSISITTALLIELNKQNIDVIFCDEKSNPSFSIAPFSQGHRSYGSLKKQMAWTTKTKKEVWTRIVREKILNQRRLLIKQNHFEAADLLEQYLSELVEGDETNREGHAAKVYFNALFGQEFSRRKENVVNGPLNYGYSIILSTINRNIVTSGYLTQLGIWHDNEFNHFNLGCDLMEPIRPFVDLELFKLSDLDDFKLPMANILNIEVEFDGKKTLLSTALNRYVHCFLNAMNDNDPKKVIFPIRNEL